MFGLKWRSAGSYVVNTGFTTFKYDQDAVFD